MSRRLVPAILIAAILAGSGCGGGDDDNANDPPAPTSTPSVATPSPDQSPSADQLPPAFVQCMADQGYDVSSSADIHSAPPEVLQMCFGTLHGGGG